MPGKDGKFVACIDFDGVISQYHSWKGVDEFEEPVAGVAQALSLLKSLGWIIIINTSRVESALLRMYLEENDIPFDHINEPHPGWQDNPCNNGKPPADVYIDDKAHRFNGSWADTLRWILLSDIRRWEKKKGNHIQHPSHYNKGGIEVVEAIEAWELGWNLSNVVKYVVRARHKGQRVVDLKKAAEYLRREIVAAEIEKELKD
jgi:hypothetical protein